MEAEDAARAGRRPYGVGAGAPEGAAQQQAPLAGEAWGDQSRAPHGWRRHRQQSMQAEHAEATTAVKDGVCVYVRTARWASGGGAGGAERPAATGGHLQLRGRGTMASKRVVGASPHMGQTRVERRLAVLFIILWSSTTRVVDRLITWCQPNDPWGSSRAAGVPGVALL